MNRREGFTLISVLVAITLLSVGIMALARTQFTVVSVTRKETQRTQALQLASAYVEEIRSRDAWSLANEGPTAIDSTGTPTVGAPFTRQMVVSDEGTQLVRVTVTVTPRGGTSPIVFRTMIFKVSR